MTWHGYQLEETVLKANEEATLWQTGRGLVKISRNTLALPIKVGDQRKGYVFHGHGQLILDTIVETDEGAIGRPVDEELNSPFLMLGAKEELCQHFDAATEEDLRNVGYEHYHQFITEAQTLCKQFFDRGMHCNHGRFDDAKGLLLAFSNGTPEMDILLVKDSELVYKKTGFVFVSSKDNSILKSHGMVVLSHNGRSFVVN